MPAPPPPATTKHSTAKPLPVFAASMEKIIGFNGYAGLPLNAD
jgi:hypothetical protein